MSKLISGKEALIALANGEEVEYKTKDGEWNPIPELLGSMKMRLKPRTITINGIEVPAPFEPKEYEDCYILTDLYEHGYTKTSWKYSKSVPAWRTESDIKQVVAALRQVFGGSHDN